MFFARVAVAFIFERAKRCDYAGTSFGRLDNPVNVTLLRSDKRVCKALENGFYRVQNDQQIEG